MDKIDELLTRGVDKIYPSKEALEKVLRAGKKLRLYQGFDPTGSQLHIGHAVGFRKLRQWQDLGHEVIFLIGDGTGQAGDPSGKKTAREKFFTRKELRQNGRDYVMQAGKIVRFDGPNPVKILYNGDWLNKLGLVEILNIAGHFTLQQMLERDLYQERLKSGIDLSLREFLYPLLQGYDSVAMEVDLELGGSDQIFNMLAGRKLVKAFLRKEKFVMTTPLLADSKGVKIGKTEGNVIALTAPLNDFYGMIMSLSDDVIDKCFEYITDLPISEVEQIRQDLRSGKNPMQYKKLLAFTLTKMLNSEAEAKKAEEFFEKTFQKKEIPENILEITIPRRDATNLIDVLVNSNLVSSRSEAKRLIGARAIELNGKVYDNQHTTTFDSKEAVIRVGKHKFAKISID